ncbi:hypothetical protein RM51_02020 [Chryseobacterium taiwanense]|uniref:Uncharacterized protein n=1 Tax=Chryseobacterium taiwanense TaxID=363331 RepID=A0A0B4DJY2_9FLAO|nr:hypothetical protein RM51_02020 [Chryseobacterium taiwanense]
MYYITQEIKMKNFHFIQLEKVNVVEGELKLVSAALWAAETSFISKIDAVILQTLKGILHF